MTIHILEASGTQVVCNRLRGAVRVGFVFRRGGDTGDAEQVFEFVEKALFICADVGIGRL